LETDVWGWQARFAGLASGAVGFDPTAGKASTRLFQHPWGAGCRRLETDVWGWQARAAGLASGAVGFDPTARPLAAPRVLEGLA